MTTGPAAGFKTNLKFWNPNCQISNFKRTPRVLQVSAGAKTECKMTARVPSFDFSEKIDRAAQSLIPNLRKTRFLMVSVAFLSVAVSPTRKFFYLKKTFFFGEIDLARFGFFASFSRYLRLCVFFLAPCRKRSLVRAGYTG